MPKSNKPDKKSTSQPVPQKLIEIDEGVFGGRISDKMPVSVTRLEEFIRNIKDFELILEEDDDSDQDDENYDYEQEFEKKITQILQSKDFDVNHKNLTTYLSYLKKNLKIPCTLTGSDEFEWEEYYILGGGSKKEYEKLKKTKPSYLDIFKLTGLSDYIDEEQGIMAEVERLTDQRKFTIPLWELDVTEENSENSELLDHYVVWFVNYL